MNWQQIIDFWLNQTHTNTSNVSAANQELYLNLAYIDTIDELIKLKVAFLFDEWVTSTVIWQNEYLIEKLWVSPDALNIKTIRNIYIKYSSTDTYHTPADRVNPNVLEYHPDWYADNQPKSEPFFYIADNSFFIFPKPTEAVTGGIEIFVIHDAPAIDSTTTQDNIEVPLSYHKAISYKMREYILDSQGKTNEAEVAAAKWQKEITKVNGVTKPRTSINLQKTMSKLNSFR